MIEKLEVLVVDDEPGMRMGIVRTLQDYQVNLQDVQQEVVFNVNQASTAEEGLDIINRTPPQILLLDQKLPGMSGLELLKKIDLKNIDMLVIMITAYASLETAIEATRRGAYDFLAKPFSPSDLKNMIQKAASRVIFQRQAKQLAEEKKRLRFEFISVLAHELKAPLAAIEGYLRMVQDKTLGDAAAAYDHMIDRSLIRLEGMRKLIFDLLDLTKVESHQKKREISDVSVYDIAEHCIETASVEAVKQNIEIEWDVPKDLVIKADGSEIEIILNNLLSNAVKYNRQGGKACLRVSKEGEKIKIIVSDTGIGLSKDEAAKLFNDFVRIKNHKTVKILGSGLGLSLVKKLAMFYNGDVSVESEPDVGSTFTVELNC